MKILDLTPFNLTWEYSPGSTPFAGFSTIAYVNSFTYNRDIAIHSIIGSGFIDASVVGASPYGAYVLVDRDEATTRVLNPVTPVSGIIFGLVALANTSSGILKEDINGRVNYRQPIKIPSGRKVSAYVMRNSDVFGSGRGLFTILAEVL